MGSNSLFERVKAFFGLIIPVLVQESGPSSGQTAFLGSVGRIILVSVLEGGQSRGQAAFLGVKASFGRIILVLV